MWSDKLQIALGSAKEMDSRKGEKEGKGGRGKMSEVKRGGGRKTDRERERDSKLFTTIKTKFIRNPKHRDPKKEVSFWKQDSEGDAHLISLLIPPMADKQGQGISMGPSPDLYRTLHEQNLLLLLLWVLTLQSLE